MRLRSELLDACDFAKKMGDSHHLYGPALGCLSRLAAAIRPKKFPGVVRERAQKLKKMLTGFYKRIEIKAINRVGGLCAVIYDEISGEAGSALFRRVEAAGAAEKAAVAPVAAAAPVRSVNYNQHRSQRGGNAQRYRKPLADVECHQCHQLGHFKAHCPNKQTAK